MTIDVYSDTKVHIVITDDDVYVFSSKQLYLSASKTLQALIDDEPDQAVRFLSKYNKIKNKNLFFKICALLGKLI
jgi:hypothetical protein